MAGKSAPDGVNPAHTNTPVNDPYSGLGGYHASTPGANSEGESPQGASDSAPEGASTELGASSLEHPLGDPSLHLDPSLGIPAPTSLPPDPLGFDLHDPTTTSGLSSLPSGWQDVPVPPEPEINPDAIRGESPPKPVDNVTKGKETVYGIVGDARRYVDGEWGPNRMVIGTLNFPQKPPEKPPDDPKFPSQPIKGK